MTKLDQTQHVLWRLITAREGAAGALAALPDADRLLPGGLDGLVRGDDRLGAVERVDVYANMYFFRLLECLTEDFPALHAVVGHPEFHALAADFLEAHPSRHPSVREVGRPLADFLETHPLTERFYWLPDLARFERDLLDAFDAADANPVGEDRLASFPAEDWPALRFALTPSLRVLEACASVDEAWSAATSGRELPPLGRTPTSLRIWREGVQVFHRRLEPVELAALRAVESGARFDEVCEAAAEIVGEERAAAEVVAVLRRWLGDGMIVAVEVSAC